MSDLATEGNRDVAHLLLCYHDRVEPPAANVETEPTELPSAVSNALELLRVFFDQVSGPMLTTCLFIADQGRYDVPGWG